MTRRAAPLLPVLACAVLAACGGSADAAQEPAPTTTSTPSDFRVEGKIEVSGYAAGTAEPNKCWSNDGYDDVGDGTQVVVTGADGKTVALGKLSQGWHPLYDEVHGAEFLGRKVTCTYFFAIDGVAAGEKFYGVEVAHRGVVQYSNVEVQEPLTLTLG